MRDSEKLNALANVRDLLQSTSEQIEKVISLEAELNQAYEDLMSTAKAVEVSGLFRPNVFPMIQELKEQRDVLKNFQFSVECNLKDRQKSALDKWMECINKIPQKDAYELEGIENWRISQHEMVPNSAGIHKKLFREEAYKLMSAGFALAFNTDYGVGSIRTVEDGFDGFVIELWQDAKKTNIHKQTLDEVLDWIIYFYDGEGNKNKRGKRDKKMRYNK